MESKSLKVITLNTWGGRLLDPLLGFLKKKSKGTDIFCFQELLFGERPRFTPENYRENLFDEICAALPDFNGYPRYAPERAYFNEIPMDFRCGQAIFVKKSIQVTGDGAFPLYPEDSWITLSPETHLTGNFQFVEIHDKNINHAVGDDASWIVGNVHGLWFKGSKSDNPERIEQSRRLVEFFAPRGDKKILCGDFNLRPQTESISLIGGAMKNLIDEYKTKTTRNGFYKDMEKYKDYIADYIFVSPDVEVKQFKVLPDEVSDHAPLFLEAA